MPPHLAANTDLITSELLHEAEHLAGGVLRQYIEVVDDINSGSTDRNKR